MRAYLVLKLAKLLHIPIDIHQSYFSGLGEKLEHISVVSVSDDSVSLVADAG